LGQDLGNGLGLIFMLIFRCDDGYDGVDLGSYCGIIGFCSRNGLILLGILRFTGGILG